MKSKTYEDFVNKFKPKKTTDDCYTPPAIYEAVKNWACNKYGILPDSIVRPFYPGGDYEHYPYPAGCTVLDNPPFSILTKICEFYLANDIKFFLFAPTLTAFGGKKICMEINHIICGVGITYHNGACVSTSFVTNYGGDIIAQTAPDLNKIINEANKELIQEEKQPLPKYEYPCHVLTAAMMQKYSRHGITLEIRKTDCAHISKLDAQAKYDKSIYGTGLLLSDKAAKAHSKAKQNLAEEKQNCQQNEEKYEWALSDREKGLIKKLGGNN